MSRRLFLCVMEDVTGCEEWERRAMKTTTLAAASALLFFAGDAPAQAAGARDQGDWPCKQIRVAHLSQESVWTGPALDAATRNWRDDKTIVELVAPLAARRTPIADAEKAIADFARAAGDQRKERLTLLFAALYERLDAERGEVVAGLDRYGLKQKEMAERLRNETQALREQQNAKPADPAKVKEASDALLWDMRVFEERGKAVGFVCETPALIEQRLGALARAILGAME